MIFIRLHSSSAFQFQFADLPGTFPHSTCSFTLIHYLPKNLTAFFQNKLKWGIRKMDETKEEESVHSRN